MLQKRSESGKQRMEWLDTMNAAYPAEQEKSWNCLVILSRIYLNYIYIILYNQKSKAVLIQKQIVYMRWYEKNETIDFYDTGTKPCIIHGE